MLDRGILVTLVLELMMVSFVCAAENAVVLNGEVVDADTGEPLAHRVYIQDRNGNTPLMSAIRLRLRHEM